MLKSIFAKYILTFMVIIIISFSMILAIVTSIIGSYSQDAKENIMRTVSEQTGGYLSSQMDISGSDSLAEYLESYPEYSSTLLTAATANEEDITLILTDNGGAILAAYGGGAQNAILAGTLPSSFMSYFESKSEFLSLNKADNIFDEPHVIRAVPVTNANGETVGSLFACTTIRDLSSLLRELVKVITMAIIWVLLAALIAVYIISEHVIAPLKAISRAAKSFAAGDFNVRVPVKGHDEVAELAVAFNNMAESLDTSEKMRNSFISNVSHDLRSPMTSISGFIDGILDGVIPPEKYTYYLTIVSNEVKRLSRLVATLLDLSRIEAGERKFTMAPFDICEMARQILFSFEKKIEEKKLRIDFDFDEENVTAIADSDAIHQVLYNLCDNAVKFSSEGGLLKVSVKKQRNRKYLVSVYNEGEGILPDDKAHVFDRFYKSDRSRGLDKTGAGLGLYISKTIIEAHGEEMTLESEYGKNCIFSFTVKGQ